MAINIKYLLIMLTVTFLFPWTGFNQAIGQTNEQPASDKLTFVIVHGAWGGSWAFRQVDSLLSRQGYSVYRPSLTGQGERVHLANPDIDLNTHIEDVVNVLLYEELHHVVLVGHSYGGMVITGVADRIPDRIQSLIYLDAFMPNNNESVASLVAARGGKRNDWDKDGMSVPPWLIPDKPPPKDVPQSLKTFTEPLILTNVAAQQVSGSYILTVNKGKEAMDDTYAPFAERAKRRGWAVLQLEADHNPQWSAPEALVDMLIDIVKSD